MKRISVHLAGGRSHTIFVGARLEALGTFLATSLSPRRVLVISAAPIARPQAEPLMAGLRRGGFRPSLALFPDGESHKKLAVVERLYRQALAAKLDRGSLVVALGGGVVGDVAGFVAATYMRGIDFVQCPTTLLAMVDASIGGKTGVDLPEGKNLVGAFWQPRWVWMDLSTLKTLPDRQWRTGLAEIVKYGMIADAALFKRLESLDLATLRARLPELESVVARSAEIKAKVVSIDERETRGLRATLNLGHTFGHAIETVSGYRRYTHGEAVSIGLCAAARLGARLGTLREPDVLRVERVLARWGLPTRVTGRRLARSAVLAAMARDKKVVDGQFRFVVPVGIGRAKGGEEVPRSMVIRVLEEVGL